MTITQPTSRSVVVSWETPFRSSTRVLYRTRTSGEISTPEYATHDTVHQIQIANLSEGQEYVFIAQSTDDNGIVYNSEPMRYRMQTVTPRSQSKAMTTDTQEDEALPFSFVSTVQEAQQYSAAQTGSVVFFLLAFVLAVLIVILEESTWLVLAEWLIGLVVLQLWRSRRHQIDFVVRHAVTGQPLADVEVTVLENGQSIASWLSDKEGRVVMEWPKNKALIIRVSREGYRTVTHALVMNPSDIVLEPLVSTDPTATSSSVSLRSGLRATHLVTLILGSLMSVAALIQDINSVTLFSAVLFALLWLTYYIFSPRPYRLIQVIDSITHHPVSGAKALYMLKGKKKKVKSDQHGFIRINYPLPDTVKLMKSGYQARLQKELFASSPRSGILKIELLPQPKE